MKIFSTLIFFSCAFISFSGCTSEVWYGMFQEIERLDCSKIEDPQERQECLDKADEMSYDQYEKEREQYQKEKYEQYQKEREEAQEQ